jgi:hypothetical protein
MVPGSILMEMPGQDLAKMCNIIRIKKIKYIDS